MRREFLWLEKDMYVGRYILSWSLLWVPHTYLMLSLSLKDGYMIYRSSRGFDHAVA